MSYDIYQIKSNNYSLTSFKSLIADNMIGVSCKSDICFKSGFLSLNHNNMIIPVDFSDTNSVSDANPAGNIGIWISDLPSFDEE